MHIDPTGSMLTPFDITNLRTQATTPQGVNTADGIAGQAGNGKNHIQFDNITGFSGGTAAISINRIALPAILSSFQVDVIDCDATLTWQSESELSLIHI